MPGRGAARGRAAHGLLAAAAQGLDYTLWECLDGDALDEDGATPGDVLRMLAAVSAVWESELGARIRRATRVLVEVPFAIVGEAGALGLAPDEGPTEVLLEGVTELALLDGDGQWTRLDHTTDAGAATEFDTLVAHCAPRGRQYAFIWRQRQPHPFRPALLVFVSAAPGCRGLGSRSRVCGGGTLALVALRREGEGESRALKDLLPITRGLLVKVAQEVLPELAGDKYRPRAATQLDGWARACLDAEGRFILPGGNLRIAAGDGYVAQFKDFSGQHRFDLLDHVLISRKGLAGWHLTVRIDLAGSRDAARIEALKVGIAGYFGDDAGLRSQAEGALRAAGWRDLVVGGEIDLAESWAEGTDIAGNNQKTTYFGGVCFQQKDAGLFGDDGALVDRLVLAGVRATEVFAALPPLGLGAPGNGDAASDANGADLRPAADAHEFEGFHMDAFGFFRDLTANNNKSWFDAHRDEFRDLVDRPLRALLGDLGKDFIPRLDPGLETEVKAAKVMGRINKNRFGRTESGLYHRHYWGAFYPRHGSKFDDPKLFVLIDADEVRAGLDITASAKGALERLRSAVTDRSGEVWDALGDAGALEWRVNDNHFDMPDEASLQDWANGSAVTAFRRFSPSRDQDLISSPGLVAAVAEALLAVYPLYLLATSPDPGPDLETFQLNWRPESGDPPPVQPGSTLAEVAAKTYLPKSFLQDIVDRLLIKKQVILYGPPGTGKTFVAEHLAAHLASGGGVVRTVQFHPSYAYEDFMEGIRPRLRTAGADQTLAYALVPGIFKAFCRDAAMSGRDRTHVLIIDEINRANLSRVMGELLYLLEYRDEEITLPYSQESFRIPTNVLLIGTMNSVDRSIALVDYALRRRFSFVSLFPDEEVVKGVLPAWVKERQPAVADVAQIHAALNDRLRDRHLAIGHSYFMPKDGALDEARLKQIWRFEITPLLEEMLFEEPARLKEFDLERLRAQMTATTAPPILNPASHPGGEQP